MARFFSSKYSGKQIEKALDTMLSPTSVNKFGVASVNGITGIVTDVGMLPVGAIYMSYVNVSPASFIAGSSWQRINDVFLLAAGNTYAAATTGGSASHNHIIGEVDNTNAEALIQYNIINGQDCILDRETDLGISYMPTQQMNISLKTEYAGQMRSSAVQVVGSTRDTETLPPYLSVYMWRRIS